MPALRRWLALGLLATGSAGAATIADAMLARPEGERHYLLANAEAAMREPRPLVILLHGHGGTAAQLLGRQRSAAPLAVWLTVAEREGLVVAAPDGLKGGDGQPGWNDCRANAGNNPGSDDVAFIAELISDRTKPQVALLRIDGGGHVEPSIAQRLGRLYKPIVGPQNADLESAEEAWAFFSERRSEPPAGAPNWSSSR